MALSCAVIRRDSVSLLKFLFLARARIFGVICCAVVIVVVVDDDDVFVFAVVVVIMVFFISLWVAFYI